MEYPPGAIFATKMPMSSVETSDVDPDSGKGKGAKRSGPKLEGRQSGGTLSNTPKMRGFGESVGKKGVGLIEAS